MSETQTFESYIDTERKRLAKQRDDVLAKKAELDTQLADIEKELSAIDAYENVKKGKAPVTRTRTSTGTRRTGIRQDVLAEVKKHPDGIAPADIREALGMHEKSDAQAVSNALAALKKQNAIAQKDDGLYVSA